MWYIENAAGGQYFRGNEAVTVGGVQYPGNFPKGEIPGAVLCSVDPKPDERWYDVQEHRVGPTITYTATAKPLDFLKAGQINGVKRTASEKLSPSDYKSLRALERGEQLDPALKAWREAVRLTSNLAEDQINACATVDELAALPPVGWPEL